LGVREGIAPGGGNVEEVSEKVLDKKDDSGVEST